MSNEWGNWRQVTVYIPNGYTLFRSAAPNYTGKDSSQRLTATAVAYLRTKGVNGIISFNENSYTDAEKALLGDIQYLHVALEDFSPPTLAQIETFTTFFRRADLKTILVHCGAGFGRTGTGVTAIQLNSTQGQNPPENTWKTVNDVETDAQVAVLSQYQASLR